MILPVNPYQYTNPVYHKSEFFDRQFVINRLRQALHAHRSIQLIGQWRIGKSSLLRYVQEHLAEFVDDDRAIAIYYDLLRRPQLRNGDDFFARILQLMSNTLVERGQQGAALPPQMDLTDPIEFEEFCDCWIDKEGYRFILLLDEFGSIARNKNFDWNFFANLRSTIPDLTYILASPRSLSDFAHEQVITSPLWNQLQLIQVTLFEKRQFIQELIHKPVEQIGLSWPDKAENFVYERGGQYPCYIQMAATALYDTYDQGQLNYKQAEKVFRDTATDHFRHLWTKTLYDQYRPKREDLLRMALLDLVHGRGIDDDLAEDLEFRSLVWRNESTDQWEPFSVWFADWLRRWSTDKRIQTEAESKRLRKQTKSKFPKSSLSDLSLQKGQLVGEQYRVQKTVGATRYSQVVVAYDESLKRKVVIKCLRVDQEPDDIAQRLRENLLRGAGIMANLDHPNIGRVYHALLNPLGVVMQWIEGLSFQDILDIGRRISATDAIKIGIELASALNYAHEQGVIHRDIKPGNIILTESEKPVLIDFDIARATACETISRLNDGSFGYVGTKEYSAPEQFLNPEGVGSPTDLFALGLVLYRLLTGRLPYEHGNLPSLYEEGHFPKPEQFDIPEPLYRILYSLLHQQPGKRPTAAKLCDELKTCASFLETYDSEFQKLDV